MPLRLTLKTGLARWLILPGSFAMMVYLWRVPVDANGYGLADWSTAAAAEFLVLPMLAAAAAAEAAGIRNQLDQVRCQPTLAIRFAMSSIAPYVLVSLLLAVSVGAARSDLQAPSLAVLFPLAFAAAAHSLLGAAIALRVSKTIATATALIGSYLLLVIPFTLSLPWPRHLVGLRTSCCLLGSTLSPRATWGALIFNSALLLLGFAGLLFRRPSAQRPALLVSLATVLVAALIAHPLGTEPMIERATSDLVCTATRAVCVWPEHRRDLAVTAKAFRTVRKTLSAHGIPLPPRASEGRAPQSLLFAIAPSGTEQQIRSALIAAAIPALPRCASQGQYPAGTLRFAVEAILVELVDGTPLLGDLSTQEVAFLAKYNRVQAPEAARMLSTAWVKLRGCQSVGALIA